MRLAILVVYLFRPERRGLFQLHLSKIRENTKVPYRIFGSVGHLPPDLAAEVAAEPDVEAVHLPVGVQPGPRNEHADLLERLFQEALKDDFTHFCTMHTDSFPVAPDWVEHLTRELENGAEFATLAPHGYSACLFWPRGFYERHPLTLLVPEAERHTETFRRFIDARHDYDGVETGLNYLYHAWRHGLRWHEIRPSHGDQLYDGRIFHLVAGTRYTITDHVPVRFAQSFFRLRPVLGAIKSLIPRRVWLGWRRRLVNEHRADRDGSAAEKKRQLDLLLADPDGYLRENGVRKTVRPA